MAGNVVSNVKKYYGGQVPVPGQGDSDGKVKVLVEKAATMEIGGVQTEVELLFDSDDLTTPVTPQQLGQWTDENYLIAFKTRDDEGVVRGYILYALETDSASTDTLVTRATFTNFKEDMEDPGASAYVFEMVEDSSTLTRYLRDEDGELIVKFNKACVEAGAQSGTLDELINTDTSHMYFEVTHEDGKSYLTLNTEGLGEIIDDIGADLQYILGALDELPSDEHGYFNSSLYTTPGDGTTTNLAMDDFRITAGRDVSGENIEFVPTRQEGGVDFGNVYLEPGTYILAIQYTLQWAGYPRGTFLPKVCNVADQPFDFSYEHEDTVRVTRIVTRTTRGKLVTNIPIDADTPPMGVYVKSLEVVQVATFNHSAVAHDTTLTGTGKLADPLGVTADVFGKIKDIPTSISQFRTGDVIPVDGPIGPAKIGKDDLLKETAQNALAENVAVAFDPNRTESNKYIGGRDCVIYKGSLYRFISDHYGAWNQADVARLNLNSVFKKRYFLDASALGIADISTLLSEGVYYCDETYSSNLENIPTELTFPILITVSKMATDFAVVSQRIIDSVGHEFFRFWGQPGYIGSSWTKIGWNKYEYTPVTSDFGLSDMNDLLTPGEYYISKNRAANISNLPILYSFPILVRVERRNSPTYTFVQTVTDSSGLSYVRTISGRGTISNWSEVTVAPEDFLGGSSTTTPLSTITRTGSYYVNANYRSIPDVPSDAPESKAFNLFVNKFAVSPDTGYIYCSQIIVYPEIGVAYSRRVNKTTNVATEWSKIGGSGGGTAQISDTRYISLGDSITRGVWHDKVTPSTSGKTDYGYPYWVKEFNGYASLLNAGVGSSGWVVHPSATPNHEDTYNSRQKVDSINFANYDLVTLSWGTNDYYTGATLGSMVTSTSGDDTVVGNMMYCINKILTDNPEIKIVILGPINRAQSGTAQTNYALGQQNSSGYTMQNLIDMMKTVCTYYGIQFIDQTQGGVVNRVNILNVLPDRCHPYESYYKVIGKYIAKNIKFA